MDDYTWRLKLHERKNRERRSLLFIFIIIAAILGSLVWYFFIYVRTPEYALKNVQQAIEANDSELFTRYVNLPLLTSRAYDDLTYDLFAYDSTLTPASRVMFEKFYILVKPELTAGLEQIITDKIKNNAWLLPSGTDILKGRQLGIDFERFIERSQLRNTSFIEIIGIDHGEKSATAHVKVRDDYTATDFTLDIVLEENSEHFYQVSYIANYRDYLDTVAKVQNSDIASYIDATKEIVEDSNSELARYQNKFQAYSKTTYGKLTPSQREGLARVLENRAIPALKNRLTRLDEIAVPAGAKYLANQRRHSAELSIEGWQHLIKGLREDNHSEYDKAETITKEVLEIELRIADIIHHTAISQNIPNLP